MNLKKIKWLVTELLLAALLLTACSSVEWTVGKVDEAYVSFPEASGEKIFEDVTSADYKWRFISETDDKARLEVKITLREGKSSYTLMVSGEIDKETLPSGELFWNGALDTECSIENCTIPVTIFFSRWSGSEDVRLSLTFGCNYAGAVLLPNEIRFGS